MKIFDLRGSTEGNRHSLSAQIGWEDCDRPNMEVVFRTRGEENVLDASNYNAFLVACLSPALYLGERRIEIDGEVCPWLVDNLASVIAYLNLWYWYEDPGNPSGKNVKIEAKSYTKTTQLRKPRIGLFFSGGVDSLYTLRRNMLSLPEGHPGRISDAIFLYGFDLRRKGNLGTQEDAFEYFVGQFEPVLRKANVNLIPLWTNVRQIGPPDRDYWHDKGVGIALGSVAHAVSAKLTECLIASSYPIANMPPFSSHPLIDPRLSSFNLRVHHDGERTARVDKVKFLSEWQVAHENLRVCVLGKPGMLNCGVCSKCIRTKLELLCANSLHRTTVFENNDINIRLIARNFRFTGTTIPFCQTLVRALSDAARKDLAAALAIKGLVYHLKTTANVRGMIARIDKKIVGGSLKSSYRRLKRRTDRSGGETRDPGWRGGC